MTSTGWRGHSATELIVDKWPRPRISDGRGSTPHYTACVSLEKPYVTLCVPFCLSDLHSTGQCPENPSSVSAAVPWFSSSTPGPSHSPGANFQEKLCYLYNAIGGSRCNFENCKFAHKCSACRGQHPRAFCRKVSVASGGPAQGGNRVVKRPRME